jgi:hypothetical protein
MSQTIRIGGASGYWGDSDLALPQFLRQGNLDYIVFDYLAEITMSIMARQRMKKPDSGFAADFVTSALRPHLHEISRQGIRIISNAGGVNPAACGRAVRSLIESMGLHLKVAVIEGDNLSDRAGQFADRGIAEMFSREAFPKPASIASINAYTGAFPIAVALAEGADIVITGRCVDSAVTLGACIHAFGWSRDDLDRLAAGSLCGHIIECGPQATGGNFTDWRDVEDMHAIGYPIAEIDASGAFTISKPDQTGGFLSVATVAEQMLYEIGDPRSYILPDVVCDFSNVTIEAVDRDRVRVVGARGRPRPQTLKVCATYEDGWRAGTVAFFHGEEAAEKARAFGKSVIRRAQAILRDANAADFSEVCIEVTGDGSVYGQPYETDRSWDVALKLAVRHPEEKGAGLILKEFSGHGLGGPPGLCAFAGTRPQPSPVIRLFSFLIGREEVGLTLSMNDGAMALDDGLTRDMASVSPPEAEQPPEPTLSGPLIEVPLIRLAYARSGDKGDIANIGLYPRRREFVPWIWKALDEGTIARRFHHLAAGRVDRFYLPGTGAMNFLLHRALGGGGVVSLRNDPQGKSYSQILLRSLIPLPEDMVRGL